MKKSHLKYDDMLSYELINKNYKDICKNTKHKNKIVKYDLFHSANTISLYNELLKRKYIHSKFNIFLIKEPKYRIVMSESIKDKIVNHLVSNTFLKPALYPKLIEENVATRVGKGTNEAIKLCKKYFIRMMNKYEKFYVLKFDISKYFYNIDHTILKHQLKKVFTDPEIFHLLCIIIDSTNAKYINEEIERCILIEKERLAKKSNKEAALRYKELERIPRYLDDKGLGIGSLSSQIFAVFYLNSLDHFIKEQLHFKEYIRFMDDGIIFCEDKERLKETKDILQKFLKNLNLELNNKTEIFSSVSGFEFVGYRFFKKNNRLIVRIKNQTKKRMKRKFKNLNKYDKEKLIRVKASYNGFLKYCTVKSLYRKNF